MEEKKTTKPSQGITVRIVVPVLIAVVIVTIWYIKNIGKSPAITGDNSDFSFYVSEEIDLDKLKLYGLPVMLNFGADYCTYCREMMPVLEKLNKELQGKAIINYIDTWEYPEIAQNYPIRAVPTQIFFDKEGKAYTPSDPQASRMIMYSLKDTNEHVFTVHEGFMTEEEILAVLKEMGLEE